MITTRRIWTTLALLLSALAVASPGEAATVRGQVRSVMIEHCGTTSDSCVGEVTLVTPRNQRLALDVDRDTEITRAGRTIGLGELVAGQIATFSDVNPVRVGGRMPRQHQAP